MLLAADALSKRFIKLYNFNNFIWHLIPSADIGVLTYGGKDHCRQGKPPVHVVDKALGY